MVEENDIIDLLEKKLAEVERQAVRLKAAIAALRDNSNGSLPETTTGVIPPIIDICKYLAQENRAVAQRELIAAIGKLRQQRYPTLSNHFSNTWRAIEYHVRHNRLILCVDERGQPVELKPLPRRPKGRKFQDSAELYEENNWFRLKDQEALKFPQTSAGSETRPR